jgi:hypothetical protein
LRHKDDTNFGNKTTPITTPITTREIRFSNWTTVNRNTGNSSRDITVAAPTKTI